MRYVAIGQCFTWGKPVAAIGGTLGLTSQACQLRGSLALS